MGLVVSRPWTWNGTTIKTPSEYEWGYQDLSSEETGRSLDGTAYKDLVAVKRSLNVTWWHLPDAGETFTTVNMLSTIKSSVFGTLSYPDPSSATNIAKTFYTGDVKCTQYDVSPSGIAKYRMSVSFIEQ